PTGSYTLRFDAGGLSVVTSGATTLGAGAATRLGLTTQPSATAQSGAAFTQQPVIQLRDAAGNLVSQSGTLVTATIASGPAGASLSGILATTGPSGAATFSGLGIRGRTGGDKVRFAAGGLAGVTSGNITLGAGVATQLALTTQLSATAQSGAAFPQQPVVQLRDAADNPVSQSGTVVTATIASGPAGATLSSIWATTGPSGAATFSGLGISAPTGSYTLRFDAGGVTGATSGTIALRAGAGTQLALTSQPSATAQSGAAFAQQPVVQLRDAAGNPVSQSGTMVTATIASGSTGATIGGTVTAIANGTGGASFTDLAVSGPVGSYALRFNAGGLTAVTSGTITLGAGAATQLGLTTQPSRTAQSGAAFTQQPVVQLRDAVGNADRQSVV